MSTADAQKQDHFFKGQQSQQHIYKAMQSNLSSKFDKALKDQEDLLRQFDQFQKEGKKQRIEDSVSYQIEEKCLECPELESNPIFQKLRNRLRQFFHIQEEYRLNGPSKQQSHQQQKNGIDFSYKIELNKALKRLLREVVVTKEKSQKLKYLGKVYAWYFGKLETMGMVSNHEKDEEELFLNPGKIVEIQRIKEEQTENKRQLLLNENLRQSRERKMYQEGERSILKEIPPAKDRLQHYKRKCFLQQSTDKLNDRPVSGVTSYQGLADVTTQAQSVFEDDERSVYSHPFAKFYTSGEPVIFKTQNRFEGRSNYYNYYPTDDMMEQKLEKFWFQNQNRELQEKRRDEEMQANLSQWSEARGRMEEEIQRKKEHQYQGNNFQKARGFVRTNWKTKNFNPTDNPLLEESSTDEEDLDGEVITMAQGESIDAKAVEKPYEDLKETIVEINEEDDEKQQEKMNAMLKQKELSQQHQRIAKSANARSRVRNIFNTKKPSVVDLTQDQISYGLRPSTGVQIKQLYAITEHNKSLPRNRMHQAFPIIHSTNVGTSQTVKKDYKKGTVELLTKFTPIGVIEDYVDPNESQASRYSQNGKIRQASVQSARKRIETLRKYKGAMINASANLDESSLDNVFINSSKGNETYTLSLYNRYEQFARPLTAPTQNNWLNSYDKVQSIPEEGQPIDTRIPDFKVPKGLNLISRGIADGYRIEQMKEVESIKDRLAKDHCPQSVVTLQRAIMIPEDVEYQPGERQYPNPGVGLLENPFTKKVKKGKKKGKGKGKKK